MSTRTQAGIGVVAAVGVALLLAGCATAGTGAAPATSGSPASALASPSAFTTVSGGGPESGPVDPVPVSPESGTGPLPTPPSAVGTDPSDPGTSTSTSADVPDWPTIQAAVAEADAQLATAKREGWWSGPVCSPDIEQHRANAGQDPLSDQQLRAECAANLAEFRASRDDYAVLQALDAAARTAELARVGTLLGLPAGQDPTVGQVVVVHGCEQGWITDPADCSGIPAG